MANTKNAKIHTLPTDRDFYPSSDGKPMAETDIHRDLMTDLIQILDDHFEARRDVYVSGNLLLYYERGNRKKSVAPDVFVVIGVEKKKRETYLLWEEGKGPDFVLELSSKKTYRTDLTRKKKRYAEVLGVPEYFLYDPQHRYLNPSLQGYRLEQGVYLPISSVEERIPSRVLGLELGLKPDGEFGLFDPETQAWLLLRKERAKHAEARAEHAEAEVARLQAELQRLQMQSPNSQ
jgi:Uma2 family endonuclease